MGKNYNSYCLVTGLFIAMLLGSCASVNGNTASGGGCCQVRSSQCTDVPRKSQCDAVQGTYHDGKECNGRTHKCE